MMPDFTRMHMILNRINEIVQRSNPHIRQRQQPPPAQSPFVELLEENKETSRGSGAAAANAPASMDDLRRHISLMADKHNIDEELIRAVIQIESGWRRDAVSSRGAMGLMQLMPRTAAMLGVEDAFDPIQNISGGVKYLAQLTDIYRGDIEKALAAYNAGRSRVNAAGGIPNIPETQRFVRNVMALYHRYREEGS